ncbi:ArsC/Spx/MgsR family protein [Flavobacteriaceae bacterium SZ-1-7]|uniref:ArsC/Spx/MgsR family protein n=1 Tax=Tamlana sedimenti TaxID=3134126 RepID=UPI0031248C36
MIIIYQHPMCRNAKTCVKLLETNFENDYDVKHEGLDLSEDKFREIVKLLNCRPIDLVRTGSIVWKTLLKNLDFTDDELIKVILKFPILIKSPIIINGNKAVIGRPPEKIFEII